MKEVSKSKQIMINMAASMISTLVSLAISFVLSTIKFKKVRANKSFTSGINAGEMFTSLSRKETTSTQGKNRMATMAMLAYMVELKYLLALS